MMSGFRLMPRERWARRAGHFQLLLLALFMAATANSADEAGHRLIALDVGEGQSLLLTSGEHGILIDTGRVGMGSRVLKRLDHHGIERLDAVVYSHLHPDHAGSWFRIHEAFPDTTVIETGHRRPGTRWPDTSRWVADDLDRLPQHRHRLVSRGDQWVWRGIRIHVLWPDTPDGGGLNERSLVLQLALGDIKILLMGDVGVDTERKLLERQALPADVDVLIAGHHGSDGTAAREFLKRIGPKFVVVSTNRNNLRGYPAARTMGRLRQYSAAVLRTWVDGDVCFALKRQGSASLC